MYEEVFSGSSLTTIFTFLDIYTIVRLARVNKTWAKAVKHERVISILDVSDSSTIATRVDIGKALPHLVSRYSLGPGLRVLNLKGCFSMKEDHLEKILQLGASTLNQLTLEQCISLPSLNCLQNKPFLSKLRTLNVSRCKQVSSFPAISCPSLSTLHVSQCDNLLAVRTGIVGNPFVQFLSQCTSLTHLDLSGSHLDDNFLTVISKLTTLQKLNLNNCNSITSTGIATLQNLNNLVSLDLSWCSNLGDQGIVPAISKAKNLQELKIAQIYNITDLTCKSIQQLPNLTVLDLEEDFRITKAGLTYIFSVLSLRELNLRGLSVDNNMLSQYRIVNPQCKIK